MAEPLNITCGTACTVTVQLEPAPVSPDRIQDMMDLFRLIILAQQVHGESVNKSKRGVYNKFLKLHQRGCCFWTPSNG